VRIRWTTRRVSISIGYAIIGFLIGVFMTPVMSAVAFAPIDSRLLAIATVPLSCLAGGLIVAASARGTCRKSPAAPVAIAIGLFAGSLMLIPLIASGRLAWVAALAPAFGLAQAAGGYFGALSGIRTWLGKPTLGVGVVCAHCAYDLDATPENWPCPECGGEWRYPAREVDA